MIFIICRWIDRMYACNYLAIFLILLRFDKMHKIYSDFDQLLLEMELERHQK